MTGDLEALWAEYLFPLAHVCHLSRDDAGGLNLTDFATYIDGIDTYIRARKTEG